MGRQIQINLSAIAERRFENHLLEKFPRARVIDEFYPATWNRDAFVRSDSSENWLIIDTRTTDLLLDLAQKAPAGPWRVPSRGRACIEWSRRLIGRPKGRLYLNTDPDPAYAELSARTGDDIERMYAAAVRWIKKNCHPVGSGRIQLWSDDTAA